MSRDSKGPYLWYRKTRLNKSTGKVHTRGTWIIIDNRRHIATGCSKQETGRANETLADYIKAKYRPVRKKRDIESIKIADVLSIYLSDKNAHIGRIKSLNKFWGDKTMDEVTGETCREYVTHKGNTGGSRRDLEDLRSAINHHNKEGLHRGVVRVSLPAKGKAKDRWLTRKELAKLLWACLTHKETQRGKKTKKRPLRHLARFILIAYYTGSRSGTVLAASFTRGKGKSFVDLDAGLFYRLAEGATETNKRQPPVPLPDRLQQHMKRWAALDDGVIVTQNKMPVKSVKKSFATACSLAGVKDATPHTLRHTTATHLMQKGVEKWQTAGFMGMSIEMLDKTYGHHHPNYMRDAAQAL